MAIAFVADGGTAAAKAVGVTTCAVTVPAGGHAAGNLLFVGGALLCTGVGITFTCTDSKGNTYTLLEVASDGGTVRSLQFASVLGTALVSGDTVTITASTANAITSYAMRAEEFSGVSVTEDVASVQAGAVSGTVSVGPITPPSAAALVLAQVMILGLPTDSWTGDSDTNGGSAWVERPVVGTTGGTGSTNRTNRLAYKITTSSAAQTFDSTIFSRNWRASLVALQETASGGSDTATMGVASASGIAPTAHTSSPAGSAAAAAGVAPTVAAAASTAAATATATELSSSTTVTATPGTAVAEGIVAGMAVAATPTPGLATTIGTGPSSSAAQTPTPGTAVGEGIDPTDGRSETPAPGLAIAAGTTPGSSATDAPTPGLAAGSGTAPTSHASASPGAATGHGVAPAPAVTVSISFATAAGITPSVATHTAPGASIGAGISPESSTVVVITPGVAVGSGIEPTITRPGVRYRLTPGTRAAEHSLMPGTRPASTVTVSIRPTRTLEAQ